ncbi:hypothetical protein GUJ93_ZPchr0004g40241 [Zizania palustris]|uniref:NTF2 domain-containing protein n=1 Tax=Zizania palustris TaxID=103762 RepID=A0A8J5SJM1_ZIZPA|nr:hypothetical protein GUJ93_ZPchr0004g40241 [Zizania palustris]
MKELTRTCQRIGGHPYAFEVGSYFLQGYYNVLANTPELACQFYTDNSTVVRLDCETMKTSFGETVEVINDMMISMNIHKVEVKTANFVESWAGALSMLVTGLVQLKDYPVRKRFVQSIVLAPQQQGYFVFSDMFKLICDEYDYYEVADCSHANQMDAHNTMTKTEYELKEASGPADIEERGTAFMPENHEVQQQDYLEYRVMIDDDSPSEELTPSLPSSTDSKQDAPLAHPIHSSTHTSEEETVGEPPKQTYASVLRTKGHPNHQLIHSVPLNKATMGEAQQNGQLTKHVQPVHENPTWTPIMMLASPRMKKSFCQFMLGIFLHLLQSSILRRHFWLLEELNLTGLLYGVARRLEFSLALLSTKTCLVSTML